MTQSGLRTRLENTLGLHPDPPRKVRAKFEVDNHLFNKIQLEVVKL